MADIAIVALPLGFATIYAVWDLGQRHIAARKADQMLLDRMRATELAIEQLENGHAQIRERVALVIGSRATQLRRGTS